MRIDGRKYKYSSMEIHDSALNNGLPPYAASEASNPLRLHEECTAGRAIMLAL